MFHSFPNTDPSPASAASQKLSNSRKGSWLSLARYCQWRLRCTFRLGTSSLACTRSINLLDQQLDRGPSSSCPNTAFLGGQLGSWAPQLSLPLKPGARCSLHCSHAGKGTRHTSAYSPGLFPHYRNFSYLGICPSSGLCGPGQAGVLPTVIIQVQHWNPRITVKCVFSKHVFFWSLSLNLAQLG